MVILQAHNKQNTYNYMSYMHVYATHGSSTFAIHTHFHYKQNTYNYMSIIPKLLPFYL